MYLFIDTTKDITVGILDDEYQWLEYEFFEGARGSALIHKCIYDQLENQNKSVKDIDGVIQIAGPGSYTGMRVSEGLSQVFNWQKFKTYSFYHYEVPELLGIKEGTWFANAFKGEYFLYRWANGNQTKELIKKDEFDINAVEDLYSSYLFDGLEKDIELTSAVIYQNSKKLFSKIIENDIKRPLYYYRTLDEEYSKK